MNDETMSTHETMRHRLHWIQTTQRTTVTTYSSTSNTMTHCIITSNIKQEMIYKKHKNQSKASVSRLYIVQK